ncbi:ABC transporter permease [Actinopolymorpha sp. B17G11]|uniref:ABC transporter permease n=1 Tax=unclassified Actinopolymorpha TaxID=2627063 RepID=UPI0032D8D339
MTAFIARRLIISFFVLLAATFLVYTLTALSGDPLADLRQDQTPQREEKIAERTERMQLDVPIPLRYVGWLTAVAQGDFGTARNGVEVGTLLGQAVSATLQLVLAATVLAIICGVMVGIVTALRQYTGFDYTVTFASFLFFSLPSFWVAVMLKQYAAIEFNNWLRDPTIPLAVIVVLALVAGVGWAAVLGGDLRRRAAAFAVAAATTGGILAYLSFTRWFADPRLGFAVVLVVSLAAGLGATTLFAGLRARDPLVAALTTAVLGSVLSLALDPVLADPTWLLLIGLALVTVVVSAAIGYVLGGLQRRQAMSAAVLTGLFSAGLIFFDHFLRAFSGYSDLVLGRPISTIGARTPNFEGDFWQLTWDATGHIALPSMALVLISFATYTRYTRASMLEILNQDYVRTARSKGLTERSVIVRHAFRNSLIPITTLMAFDFAGVVGGAIITEEVFGWQGMGRLFSEGLREVDPTRVMAFFIVSGTAIVVFNMIADIAYAYLDPRIRLS